MNIDVEMEAVDVRAWRGCRGSGDMMSGRMALVLRGESSCIEIVGTAAELADLQSRLTEAMEAVEA